MEFCQSEKVGTLAEWLVYSRIAIQLFRNFHTFFIENR